MAAVPLKVLVLGDKDCGKTALCRTFFSGASNESMDVEVNVGIPICLRFVEVGDNLPESVPSQMFIGAKAIILCFKLTQSNHSLASLEVGWFRKVRDHNPSVPVFVVGLGFDDGTEMPGIREQAREVAERINAIKYFSCTSENAEKVVPQLLKSVGLTVLIHCVTKSDGRMLRFLLGYMHK